MYGASPYGSSPYASYLEPQSGAAPPSVTYPQLERLTRGLMRGMPGMIAFLLAMCL